MTPIDESTVRHMAHLSRLELTDTELTHYTHQLAAILDYASDLPALEVETASVPHLRVDEDTPRTSPADQNLLRNAREIENGFVKVPAILDRSES